MWRAWVGLPLVLPLAEAAAQSTVELTAQYSSSTCVDPPTFVTIKESPSCIASKCCNGVKTATICSSEDKYHSAVNNLFGSTRFIIRESYDDANCTVLQSANALRLDDQCVQDGVTQMFVRSQLASDGSISVQYFTDASCSQDRLHHAEFVSKEITEDRTCDSNALRWYVSKRVRRSLAQTASSTDEEGDDDDTGTEETDATSPPVTESADGDANTNSATDDEDPNAGTDTSKSADSSPDEDEAGTSKSSDKGSNTAEPTPIATEAPMTEAPTTEPPTTAPTTTPPTTTEPPATTSAPDPTEAAVTTATPKVKKVSSTAGEADASTTSTAASTPSSKTETTDEATEDSVKGASASGSKAAATSTESSNGTTLTLIGIAAGCVALAIIILALIVRRLRAEHKSFHNATPAPATTRRDVRDPYAMQTSPFQPQRCTQRRYTTLAQKPYLLQEPTDDQPGQRPTQSQAIQEQPNPLENSVSALVAPAKQTEVWNDKVIVANRIPKEKLQVQELISRSTFGEVYSGMYDRRRVAVKMLPPQMRLDVQQVNDFLTEAKRAATMRHPHIVSFIGVAWSALSDACVVMEYMDGGDLRSLLNDYGATRHPVGFDNEKATIAMHVCQALAYMHSLSTPMIHRDLKSRNILLNQAMEAKLMDFGISREKLDEMVTAGVETSLWIAPEVLMGNSYGDKADIFSFGVVLSELDTHQLPYANATAGSSQMACAVMLQEVVAGALQVEFSQQGSQTMAELGRACTSVDPDRRPKAAEILHILQDVLSEELLECSL